jgi:chromate transporter
MTDGALPSQAVAARLWLRIGVMSFGGPAGQIALMHKLLVEERRWIGEQRFLHALNFCMLLPGPEAQQLAIYIGWLLHRRVGGLIAGLLFVLPGALVMLALSILYIEWHDRPNVTALFFGVKAAILAIVAQALLRIARRTLRRRLDWAIATGSLIGLALFNVPFPLILVAAGLIGLVLRPRSAGPHRADSLAPTLDQDTVIDRMEAQGALPHILPSYRRALSVLLTYVPAWLGPVILARLSAGPGSIWAEMGSFFARLAALGFGGAYAMLAYVAQSAVTGFGWLAPSEMLDGLGLAETTPGPLVLVLQFVGFLAAFHRPGGFDPLIAGCLGALLTLWVTFAPCFLWVFLGAPYSERLRGNEAVAAALSGISASVVGVIANLALWLSLRFLFGQIAELTVTGITLDVPLAASLDWHALVLTGAALIAVLRFRTGMTLTLVGSALAALIIEPH